MQYTRTGTRLQDGRQRDKDKHSERYTNSTVCVCMWHELATNNALTSHSSSSLAEVQDLHTHTVTTQSLIRMVRMISRLPYLSEHFQPSPSKVLWTEQENHTTTHAHCSLPSRGSGWLRACSLCLDALASCRTTDWLGDCLSPPPTDPLGIAAPSPGTCTHFSSLSSDPWATTPAPLQSSTCTGQMVLSASVAPPAASQHALY